MLRALTHTRITWALPPMAPQIPIVTPGSPCAHGVADTPHGEVRDKKIRLSYVGKITTR